MEQDKKRALGNMNRREFVLKTVVATGYALAVTPVAFYVISTDTEGIEVSDIHIPVGKSKIPGYVAMPIGQGPFPVLVICHEIFGVHEHIKDLCRRFAKLGFYVIAPNLFFRHGDVTKIKEIPDIIKKVVSKVTNKQVNLDLDATVKFAKANKKTDISKLTVTGFCWGGKTTWLYAAHNSNVKSAIAWYGPLVGNVNTSTKMEFPVDVAAVLKVPVLGLYGGKDTHITQEHVDQMEKALDKGKSGSKIIVYPDAEHGFFADYRPSYNKMASDEAIREMLNWIKSH